jgi:ribosomal protein S18 acetylase RimI-like enzyme
VIRPATPLDAPALEALDHAIWSYAHSPVPPRDRPFETEGVLIDERDGELAGYIKLGELWPLESVRHVREIKGLAVAAGHQRKGVARALIAAALDEARRQGTTKVTLRVLGHNAPARALYEACGFTVEGVLTNLFHLEGAYVDDILMSITLGGSSSST